MCFKQPNIMKKINLPLRLSPVLPGGIFTKRVNGLTSLCILAAIIVTGTIAIGKDSIFYAILYAFVTILCLAVTVALYCSRCPSRLTDCGQVIFGPLTRLFPDRPSRPYTKQDIYLRNTALLLIFLLPQLWLIHHPVMFVAFWILAIVRWVHLIKYVCVSCENRFCKAEMKLVE